MGSDEPLTTTISMGVAAFSSDSLQMEQLIAAADEALYEAKESGRDRVVAHAQLSKDNDLAEGTH